MHSNEQYTPRRWRDFAEAVFGEPIELDPASSSIANQIIQAERYYTIEDDALLQPWAAATVWLNPPYSGKEVKAFTGKLQAELPNIGQCMALFNNCSETAWFQELAKGCDRMLFPLGRINFWRPGNCPDNPVGRNSYKQALLYWGKNIHAFEELGHDVGFVVQPIKRNHEPN